MQINEYYINLYTIAFFPFVVIIEYQFLSLLKETYTEKLKNVSQFNINYVNKIVFLKTYKHVYFQILIRFNILNVFKSIGFLFNFIIVLNFWNIFLKIYYFWK